MEKDYQIIDAEPVIVQIKDSYGITQLTSSDFGEEEDSFWVRLYIPDDFAPGYYIDTWRFRLENNRYIERSRNFDVFAPCDSLAPLDRIVIAQEEVTDKYVYVRFKIPSLSIPLEAKAYVLDYLKKTEVLVADLEMTYYKKGRFEHNLPAGRYRMYAEFTFSNKTLKTDPIPLIIGDSSVITDKAQHYLELEQGYKLWEE